MKKLDKDQLVGRLVSLFREADQSHIDDAVPQAKGKLLAETRKTKRNDLKKLFDDQIATLKDRGVPEHIVNILAGQKDVVLARARKITIGHGPFDGIQRKHIPFLPVIPRSSRNPYYLMDMVRNGDKAGCTYLKPTEIREIRDVVDAPQEPYYIYDVEDGKSTRGKSPQDAKKILKKQSRSPRTAAEVMALATHTYVLSRHYVWATGSRYESASGVPGVSLGVFGGWPEFFWCGASFSSDLWGSASCGSSG